MAPGDPTIGKATGLPTAGFPPTPAEAPPAPRAFFRRRPHSTVPERVEVEATSGPPAPVAPAPEAPSLDTRVASLETATVEHRQAITTLGVAVDKWAHSVDEAVRGKVSAPVLNDLEARVRRLEEQLRAPPAPRPSFWRRAR